MDKRKVLALVMVLVLVVGALAACGGGSTTTTTGGDEPTGEVIKLGIGNVTTDNGKEAARKWQELLEEASGGTMTIEHYDDNSLGDDKARFELCKNGDVAIVVGATGNLASDYPDYYIYDMPYLFLNKDEVYNIGFNGVSGKKIVDGINEHVPEVHALGMWENGFRNLTTTNTPVESPADLSGLKIRTMDNEIHIAVWRALGANPTPMSFNELYTALQQGTVDGQENPIGIILGNGFHDVEKYIVYTEHVYSPYAVLINANLWNSFTDEQREWVQSTFDEATQYDYEVSQRIEDEADATFEANGNVVTHLTDDQKKAFQETAEAADALTKIQALMLHPEVAQEMVDELNAAR